MFRRNWKQAMVVSSLWVLVFIVAIWKLSSSGEDKASNSPTIETPTTTVTQTTTTDLVEENKVVHEIPKALRYRVAKFEALYHLRRPSDNTKVFVRRIKPFVPNRKLLKTFANTYNAERKAGINIERVRRKITVRAYIDLDRVDAQVDEKGNYEVVVQVVFVTSRPKVGVVNKVSQLHTSFWRMSTDGKWVLLRHNSVG